MGECSLFFLHKDTMLRQFLLRLTTQQHEHDGCSVDKKKNDDDADGIYPDNPRIVQLSNGNILFSWNVADHTKAIILSLEDLATETDAIAAIEAAEVLELNDSPYGTGPAPRNTGLFTTFDGGFSLAEINPHVSTDSGKTGDAVFMKFFNNDGSPATSPRAFIGDKKLRPLRIPRS